MNILCILVSSALIAPADLQKKLALPGELEQHIVGSFWHSRVLPGVPAYPDLVLVIHVNTVFLIRPLIGGLLDQTTPPLDKFSGGVEFQDDRCRQMFLIGG